MREFKIYVGLSEESMSEVLHSTLKNDSIPETFLVTYVNKAGIRFPTNYIKIVPLSAYDRSFHTSIWYISMTGISDAEYVESVRLRFEEYRESTVLLHVLKHLRQRRLLQPYKSILSSTSLRLEHPLISQLYSAVVLDGNWLATERLLASVCSAGLFDAYLNSCQPQARWKRLQGLTSDGDSPSKRGGHAMCIDQGRQIIYLFGGYDGQKALDDFWMYDIQEEKWTLLSHSTAAEKNGPEARSCHKIVFDSKTGCIYLLGRLGDMDDRKREEYRAGNTPTASEGQPSEGPAREWDASVAYCSEFHRYHTRGLDAGKWDLLSFDTASSGGPPLIFDHQMVMDCEAQLLYVFGGQIIDGDWASSKYSGLYSYNVRTSKWKILQPLDSPIPGSVIIPPRFGHSMVYDRGSHTLFIFAGQFEDKYLSDMYSYDTVTHIATELYNNFTASGGPEACFTQRAVLDTELREIYVFCGLTRMQQPGSMTVLRSDAPNWLYRYGKRPGKWNQIPCEQPEGSDHELSGVVLVTDEPQPRYAHQVVYEQSSKTVFMHGGNAGLGNGSRDFMETPGEIYDDEDTESTRGGPIEKRLDDFWSMTLNRPASGEIIRRATFQIRRQQFREMCEDVSAGKALHFLQNEVSKTVDHRDPEEAAIFRSLLSHLLVPSNVTTPSTSKEVTHSATHTLDSDSEDHDGPPKKRSRQSTPEELWTNRLSDDESLPEVVASASPTVLHRPQENIATLTFEEDPVEKMMRASSASAVSSTRFQQRTEVFERLLEFVGEDAKQPSGSLIDLMNGIE